MKIKDEYKGKTIIKRTSLGNKTIIVDNIDVSKSRYYVSIGLGYLFEKEAETKTTEQCIKYEGIEQDEQVEAPAPTPKPKRKRPSNAVAKKESKRNRNDDTTV
jgi:hypothetical protein